MKDCNIVFWNCESNILCNVSKYIPYYKAKNKRHKRFFWHWYNVLRSFYCYSTVGVFKSKKINRLHNDFEASLPIITLWFIFYIHNNFPSKGVHYANNKLHKMFPCMKNDKIGGSFHFISLSTTYLRVKNGSNNDMCY